MIKIIEKEVKIKEYVVEPKTATLYYVDKYRKDIVTFENCIFKIVTPVVWNDNECWLEYEHKERYLQIRVDITTGAVKGHSDCFFDYEQAVRVHKARRIKFLKDKIVDLKGYQQKLERLKDKIDGLKELEKELKEKDNG